MNPYGPSSLVATMSPGTARNAARGDEGSSKCSSSKQATTNAAKATEQLFLVTIAMCVGVPAVVAAVALIL